MKIYRIAKDKEYLTPEEREQVKGLFNDIQCSFAKDKDGYYCYTHRARSESYPSISQIPKDKVDFINSTSSSHRANKVIKVSNFDDIEEVMSSVRDEQESILREYFSKGRKKRSMMSWSVVPFAPLKKIWEDYAKYGVVHNEQGVDVIANQMFKILVRLQASTDLSGHSQFRIEDLVEELGFPAIDFDFYDYFLETPYGTPISDYGLNPLWKLAEQLMSASSTEQKLLLIDQMLNIIHMRGDLAALFIEGGSSALSQLSAKPEEIEASCKNWYKTAVADGEFRDWKDKVNKVKDDIRDLKKDDKDIEKRVKDLEKTIGDLNIGFRRFWEGKTQFNSLQRKMERLESVEQEWKKYKEELSDNVKSEVEKHTKARVTTFVPSK